MKYSAFLFPFLKVSNWLWSHESSDATQKFLFLRSFCFGDHFETQSFFLTTYNFRESFWVLSVSGKTVKMNPDQFIYEWLKFLNESLDKLSLVLSQKHYEWNRSEQTQWLVLFELNTKMAFSTFSQVFYKKHWTGERTISQIKLPFLEWSKTQFQVVRCSSPFPIYTYLLCTFIYLYLKKQKQNIGDNQSDITVSNLQLVTIHDCSVCSVSHRVVVFFLNKKNNKKHWVILFPIVSEIPFNANKVPQISPVF